MLSSGQRLRRSADFALTTKHGRRRKSGALVVYLCAAEPATLGAQPSSSASGQLPRAGLIVGKGVGNSVVRHRVSRRIREQLRSQLPHLSQGDRVVVRALPAAAGASSEQVSRDLSAAIGRLTRARRDES